MGLGHFLQGAAEAVGKKVDDVGEGLGEVGSDVGKKAGDAWQDVKPGGNWDQSTMADIKDPRSLIGDAGSLAGGALRGAGSALNAVDDLDKRVSSWADTQDNMSEAEWTQQYTDFTTEHGQPKDSINMPYEDYHDTEDYQLLMSNRPYGLKKDDPGQFTNLADKLSGGGNAVEGTAKVAETFTRAPIESTEFAWDNRAEIARQATNYVQSQYTPEALAEWAGAAGGAIAIATARSGARGGEPMVGEGMVPHGTPQPHMEIPTPEAPAPRTARVTPGEPVTSRLSEGVMPTTFPKTRQKIANFVAGPPEAEGIIPSARRMVARSRIESSTLPPSQRPGSSAAQAGTSRFTDFMWETKQWAARVAATKLAYDIGGVGHRIPSAAIDKYDPETAAEGLGEYNEFADGRSVQNVGRDMLTDPKQRAEAINRAEGLGLDTDAAMAGAKEYASKSLPSASDYIVPGAIAAGGLAWGAASLFGERGSGTGGGGSAQPAEPEQPAQTAAGASYSKTQQPEGISTSPTPRMDSFGAGTSTTPGRAARPSVVSGDYGYREPSVEHPLGSGMADGSQGPKKSALYAGISQPGPRMQPGERKRSESFVSGSVYGEKGMTMGGTQGWNAQTKGSYIFPELTQPNAKKPREILGV